MSTERRDKNTPKRRRTTRRFLLPLLAALSVIVLLVGCVVRANDGTYRTQRQLEAVPEEHLFYPGSVVVTHGGADRQIGPLGQRTRAYSGYTIGTDATDEEVFAFYRARLVSAGWREAPAEGSLISGQLRAMVYRKGSLLVQVTTLRKGDVRNPQAIDAYRTPYEIVVYSDLPR